MLLELGEISEIAREIIRDYTPKGLPNLEDISWAFPIGLENTNKIRPRIINYQESEALAQHSMFQNFTLVLQHLKEGKPVKFFGRDTIPNHTIPIENVEDAGHQVGHYTPEILEERLRKTYQRWPEPISLIPSEQASGFYWVNLPETLRENILKVGKSVKKDFEEDSIRDYITNLKKAIIGGTEYLHRIANSTDKGNWPRLVSTTYDGCLDGDYIELGIPSEGIVVRGTYISPDESGNPAIQLWESPYRFEAPKVTEESPKFPKEFPLWKLVNPK